MRPRLATFMRPRLATTSVLLVLAGCAGNGEGLDENGQPINGGPQPLLPDLQSIQDQVFTPICTACHAGAAAPLGFRLDAASSYAMLVNTPSAEVPSLMRVSPGNPDASYIIQKLEGHAAVGGQMPLGGPYLPQSTIDVIRQWISDGAQPTAAAGGNASATSLRAIAPMTDQVLTQAPRELLVAANGELNVTQLEAGAVTLVRSGGDGTFDDGNEITVEGLRVSIRSLAPTVVVIKAPTDEWPADRYQLRIAGRGAFAVTNVSGNAIDGAATGRGASDFVTEFTVGSTP
ncbi:MAG TPA: hypothetical protein VE046_10735 [Steroidobacteraceae bacterium]|nr:hypothetical protein [Steroidobacteraceae bacterium]